MKFVFYYILGELRDIFIPPFSLPKLSHPALMVQQVQTKSMPVPKKVSYQPPKNVCKQTFAKGHKQR